jgi:hypothetical protein
MSEIIAGPPTPAFYHRFPRLGVGESQGVSPYLSRAHAREASRSKRAGGANPAAGIASNTGISLLIRCRLHKR